MEKTTIQINQETLEKLKGLKRHPRESYEETINFLVEEIEEEISPEEIEEVEFALREIKVKGIKKTTFPIEEVAKEFGIRLGK